MDDFLDILKAKAEAFAEKNGHVLGDGWKVLKPEKNILMPVVLLDIPDIWLRECKNCGAAVTVATLTVFEELDNSLAEVISSTINYNPEFLINCPVGKIQKLN